MLLISILPFKSLTLLPFIKSSPRHVDRRQLQADAIVDQDAHEIAIHPIRDMCGYERSLLEPHAIQGAWQLLRYGPYLTGTGTSLAVRIHGPSAVTATVC